MLFMFQSKKVCFLLSIMLTLITNLSYSQEPFWAGLKSEGCMIGNVEKFSARLWDISGDWEQICRETEKTFNGIKYKSPHNCVKKNVFEGMWGEWYLKTNRCKSKWEKIKKRGCVLPLKGLRRFEAFITNEDFLQDDDAAYNIPIKIDGKYLGGTQVDDQSVSGPTQYSNGKGQFYALDVTCVNNDRNDRNLSQNAWIRKVHKVKTRVTAQLINQQYKTTGEPVSRFQAYIREPYYIIVDIGGEGYHKTDFITSGFRNNTINLNVQRNDSQLGTKIPSLVRLNNWYDTYPIADKFADYIVIQNAPLTQHNANEIVRMLRSGGKVGLWIDKDSFKEQIDFIAQQLKSQAIYNAKDEFKGRGGFPKILIEDRRTTYDLPPYTN